MPRDAWRSLPPGLQRAFFANIHDLWRAQGMPSARSIAEGLRRQKAPVQPGHVTVSNLLNGPSVPGWDIAAEVIKYLKGDPEEHLPYWRQARAAASAGARSSCDSDSDFVLDLTGAGGELELKALMRSCGYDSHSTLLLLTPVGARGGESRPADMDFVLRFVDAAIDHLEDHDRELIARCLFGIDAGWREMTLAARREEVADILRRSPRTIARMQSALITDVAAVMTVMLKNMTPGELHEVIGLQNIITAADAEEGHQKLLEKLAAVERDSVKSLPAAGQEATTEC